MSEVVYLAHTLTKRALVMLIRFSAENWKSFPKLEFSAIANLDRKHRSRVARARDFRLRLLPISAIFGGNASGKSNFYDALKFTRNYIVEGVKPTQGIAVKPFLLNRDLAEKPSSFQFEILVDERVFRYSFTVERTRVLTETLTEILPDGERSLYERDGEGITFFSELDSDESLKVVGRGTQRNLLFLTNSVFQMREEFRAVYNWFARSLLLIEPESTCSTYNQYVNRQSPFQPQNQETLANFDVGIEQIDTIDVPLGQLPFNVNFQIQKESENLIDGAIFQVGEYLIYQRDGVPCVKKMVAVHSLEQEPEVKIPFELKDESDGTRRLLDLIPAMSFLRKPEQSRVVFIDEIDRSLHHLLTRKLIEDYLGECTEISRTQLFFTTHDALLMNQDIFRRDELWLVDKDESRSELLSISDYQMRYDKKLLNAYLFGQFGGIPHLRG